MTGGEYFSENFVFLQFLGLTEFYDLQQSPENLVQLMMRGFEMSSLFGCSIEADPNVWEAKLPNGLVKVQKQGDLNVFFI